MLCGGSTGTDIESSVAAMKRSDLSIASKCLDLQCLCKYREEQWVLRSELYLQKLRLSAGSLKAWYKSVLYARSTRCSQTYCDPVLNRAKYLAMLTLIMPVTNVKRVTRDAASARMRRCRRRLTLSKILSPIPQRLYFRVPCSLKHCSTNVHFNRLNRCIRRTFRTRGAS